MDNINEKRIIASSFLLIFRDNVITLKALTSQYLTFLSNMEIKEKSSDKFDLTEEEKNYLININNELKTLINILYFDYIAMNNNKEEQEEFKKIYDKIKNQGVINEEDLKELVLKLNKFLFSDNIKELLNMAELTKNIFDKEIVYNTGAIIPEEEYIEEERNISEENKNEK